MLAAFPFRITRPDEMPVRVVAAQEGDVALRRGDLRTFEATLHHDARSQRAA
jgi:hypothetical protein